MEIFYGYKEPSEKVPGLFYNRGFTITILLNI